MFQSAIRTIKFFTGLFKELMKYMAAYSRQNIYRQTEFLSRITLFEEQSFGISRIFEKIATGIHDASYGTTRLN